MASEIAAGPGDWTRAFAARYMDKFTAPTVEGIEFPSLGVSQAWNDRATGTLHVVTYAPAPDKKGTATRWRVTNLPSVTNLTIRLNGKPFSRFVAVGPRTIELTSTIDAHQFEIVTGYKGDGPRAAAGPPAAPVTAPTASLVASAKAGTPPPGGVPANGPGCPCCAGAPNPV
jgi:hypothetical protein